MAKTRVDKIITLFQDIEKPELLELTQRLHKDLGVWVQFVIPANLMESFNPQGRLLIRKEGRDGLQGH